MEHDELECFLILAEELHFGRTADRMRLSRARVSQLVQRIERRIGAPLFVRTSRRVALTDLGRQLRDDLEPHHRAIAAAVVRATATARSIGGVLFVGFAGPPAGEIVLKAAEAMRVDHPGLSVEICEVPLSDPYGKLREGGYDVQLTEFPVREADLGHGPALLTEERVLVIASGHPLAARDSVSLEDLADVPLLTIDGDVPDYWQEHHAPARTPGGRPIAQGPGVSNMQEALMLVAGGRGALLSAAHTATYFARPGVAYVPFEDAGPVGYGLVWRARDNTDAVRAFARSALAVSRDVTPKGVAAADLPSAGPRRTPSRATGPVERHGIGPERSAKALLPS